MISSKKKTNDENLYTISATGKTMATYRNRIFFFLLFFFMPLICAFFYYLSNAVEPHRWNIYLLIPLAKKYGTWLPLLIYVLIPCTNIRAFSTIFLSPHAIMQYLYNVFLLLLLNSTWLGPSIHKPHSLPYTHRYIPRYIPAPHTYK